MDRTRTRAVQYSGRKGTESAHNGRSHDKVFLAQPTMIGQIDAGHSPSVDTEFELDLEGSGMTFEPGDALGIVPTNDPGYVARLIRTLRLDPDERIPLRDGTATLQHALETRFEVRRLSRLQLGRYATLDVDGALQVLLQREHRSALAVYLARRELLDVVADFPQRRPSAAEFLSTLRPIAPRFYSVASSLLALPGRARLLFRPVLYRSVRGLCQGVCTGFLGNRLRQNMAIPVFAWTNARFRLPSPDSTPIVMIGVGSGVAPFRAFVEHRRLIGAAGKDWLIIADRRRAEFGAHHSSWMSVLEEGMVSRLDLVTSLADAVVYRVRELLWRAQRELYDWLDRGAHLYVCGRRLHTARDIRRTLVSIIARQAACSRDAAREYVETLRGQGRISFQLY